MKKTLTLICFLACWLWVPAQSLREVWIDMPDSIMPYLTRSQRTELADYVEMKADPAVKNALGDSVRIERMTDDYLSVRSSKSSQLEIKLLNNNTLALVQTWKAPAAESRLRLFDLHWQEKTSLVTCSEDVVKPDTMRDEEFAGLQILMRPRMSEYHLSPDDNSLSVRWNYPLLSKKEIRQVETLLKPQTLHWNGKDFR